LTNALRSGAVKGIDPFSLRNAMNELSGSQMWQGGHVYTSSEMINTLNNRGSWIALLNPSKTGHYVIVDGVDDFGNLAIRDPKGVEYSLTHSDFLNWWSDLSGIGEVIFK
jgi:hypothetical protein